MLEIIKHRERITRYTYAQTYDYIGHDGWGFGFDCKKDGELLPIRHEAAFQNYQNCIAGTNGTEYKGIVRYENTYTQPTIARCTCGHEITLATFTNQCEECGTYYNMSGQTLLSPEHWDDLGEDETAADVLRECGLTVS